MFYGYLVDDDSFGFIPDDDNRLTSDFIEITDEKYNQLLAENALGKEIIIYEEKVFTAEVGQYIQQGNKFVLNPNYEEEKQEKEDALFNASFFETSLGYVRRKVTMTDGTVRDFLSDILALLQVGVPIITYNRDLTQNKVIATEEFINECKQQMLVDFYGVQ